MSSLSTWRWMSVMLAGMSALCVHAQSSDFQIEPPVSKLACLKQASPERRTPNYPSEALKASKAAVVRVRMRFGSSGQTPQIDTVFNNGGAEFAQAVEDFVSGYRLPCMSDAAEVVNAVQEFQFIPRVKDPLVFWSLAREDREIDSRVNEDCLRSVTGAKPPRIPGDAIRNNEFGTVIASMTFTSADAPPTVEILYDPESKSLANAVRAAVAKYRLPCVGPGSSPIVTRQTFTFLYGEPVSSLKPDLSLKQLLGLVKDLPSQHVRFDFSTMNCPFSVKFAPYRPYIANRVGEVGETNSNRREFVEWLRTVALDIPSKDMKTVIGQVVTVAVPCTVLDLL